jgi:hypothetical protein
MQPAQTHAHLLLLMLLAEASDGAAGLKPTVITRCEGCCAHCGALDLQAEALEGCATRRRPGALL